jgi:hypothetical protein
MDKATSNMDVGVDVRFVYGQEPNKEFAKQIILRTEFEALKPSTKSSKRYEFELPYDVDTFIRFGPLTQFGIKGRFVYKDSPQSGNETFRAIPLTDYDKVQLIPNWFEHCINSVEVCQNNQVVRSYDVPKNGDRFFNTYIYSTLDEEVKKGVYSNAADTVYSVPRKADGWTMTEGSEWHTYSKQVFGKGYFDFGYLPLFLFPFYQPSEYEKRETQRPTALPMPILQRMKIILNFEDNFDHIFVKSVNNTKVYRFEMFSIHLILENECIRPENQRSFLKQKDVVYYPGVTKIGHIENIPTGTVFHRFKLDNVMMPEGLFIFALPKSVESGQYRYQGGTNPIFSRHNIQTLELKYGGLPFTQKDLNYGIINDHMIGIKQMFDHKRQPPFGLPQDPETATTFENIINGGENTLFPHIYMKLLNDNGDRLIPIGADERILKQPHDLDVTLMFKLGGATPDVSYYAYIFYNDVIMTLDMSRGQFLTHYKHKQSLY